MLKRQFRKPNLCKCSPLLAFATVVLALTLVNFIFLARDSSISSAWKNLAPTPASRSHQPLGRGSLLAGKLADVFDDDDDGIASDSQRYSSVTCISNPVDTRRREEFDTQTSTPRLRSFARPNATFMESENWYRSPQDVHAFGIYNRSCLYRNILFNATTNRFVFFVRDTLANRQQYLADGAQVPMRRSVVRNGKLCVQREYHSTVEVREGVLPPVTLASRPYDMPLNRANLKHTYRKLQWTYEYAPLVHFGPLPPSKKTPEGTAHDHSTLPEGKTSHQFCEEDHHDDDVGVDATTTHPNADFVPRDDRVIAYYVPIVAPWNFAHTLFCDLFPIFWAWWERRQSKNVCFQAPRTIYDEVNSSAARGPVPFGKFYRFPPVSPGECDSTGEPSQCCGDWFSSYDADIDPAKFQVVAFSAFYFGKFPLPNRNKAFEFFSTPPPIYDVHLPTAIYNGLLVGTGTKSWSWVTPSYAASGNPQLWYDFRKHVIRATGAQDRVPSSHANRTSTRVSICHKKDKRGIWNADEALGFLNDAFGPSRSDSQAADAGGAFDHIRDVRAKIDSMNTTPSFFLESAVGLPSRDQVQMLLDSDIYMCNEGTLATMFFLLPPGSVFVALPLVYHTPHMHQRDMEGRGLSPRDWWRLPDLMRPDPRKHVGGNVDWFPQAIPWVRTVWYDDVPLNETMIQLPLQGLRNYMADFNHVLQREKLVEVVARGLRFLFAKDLVWVLEEDVPGGAGGDIDKKIFIKVHPSLSIDAVVRNLTLRKAFFPHESTAEQKKFSDHLHRAPNYSLTANLCRRLLALQPDLVNGFNSGNCYYGMSWLCEFLANTRRQWRFLHPKWSHSRGACGDHRSEVQFWKGLNQSHPLIGGGTPRTVVEQNRRVALIREAADGPIGNLSADANIGSATYWEYMKVEENFDDFFFDVRMTRAMRNYLFFSKEQMEEFYTTTDYNTNFTPSSDDVELVFPS